MSQIQFPVKLEPLFLPKRYKVLWGGRGAGRSWGIARALLLIGAERPIRVLCARELQKSIDESVHKLLSDQIEALGLGNVYTVQKASIFAANGTTFSFEGIKNNVNKIKSYEGVDYAWVEEAAKVSKASWNVLIPTIRKPGSEIWLSFNPELDTDYTFVNFVKNANKINDDSIVIHMNFRDNPWFPAELEAERLKVKDADPDLYLNVWEGQCLEMLEGAVYAKEMRALATEGRICDVPWDRDFPVDVWMDLGAGRSDRTSIWFAQQLAMQTRILDYYENNLSDTLHYAKEMQKRPFTFGTIWLPHDAEATKIGQVKTIKKQFQEHFPNATIRIVPKLSIAEGINAARLLFPNCYFDEEKCEEGLSSLKHYKYEVVNGQFSRDPKHDNASHGADAFRYLALTIKGVGRSNRKKGVRERLEEAVAIGRKAAEKMPLGAHSWMG